MPAHSSAKGKPSCLPGTPSGCPSAGRAPGCRRVRFSVASAAQAPTASAGPSFSRNHDQRSGIPKEGGEMHVSKSGLWAHSSAAPALGSAL